MEYPEQVIKCHRCKWGYDKTFPEPLPFKILEPCEKHAQYFYEYDEGI